MERFARALLLLPLLALPACYSHRVVPADRATPGMPVRARVTPAETARLGELLGAQGPVLRGTVAGTENGALVLQLPVATGLSGQALAQRVTIPRGEIVQLEERRLDRPRTFALVAGLVVGGGALAVSQFAAARNGSDSGNRGGVDEVRIPLTVRLHR